jgi:hypothetical protein
MAELTCEEDQSLIGGSPAYASFDVECTDGGGGIDVGDFCTQTQGGWGQEVCKKQDSCDGGNVGCFRDCNFDALFPGGLGFLVGDPDGPYPPGTPPPYGIWLTSSEAVADLLPTGGPAAALTQDLVDPTSTSTGVFAGQLVAATFNVLVDDAGLRRDGEDMPYEPGTLGELVFLDNDDCNINPIFVGLSVNQLIAVANTVISGEITPLVPVSDFSDALAVVNQNFVDCNANVGCLGFDAAGTCVDLGGSVLQDPDTVVGAGVLCEWDDFYPLNVQQPACSDSPCMVPGPSVMFAGPADFLCIEGIGFERACMQDATMSTIETIAPVTQRYFCAGSEMGAFSPDQCVVPH